MRAGWGTVGRFAAACVAAALIGSGLTTGLLFTPVMEWVGSNSSALDFFILGSIEEGLRHVAAIWRDLMTAFLAGVILIWGPIYWVLVSAGRGEAASVLSAGVVTTVVAWIAVCIGIAPLTFVVDGVPEHPAMTLGWFAFRGLVVAAVIGLAMTSGFSALMHSGRSERRTREGVT